MSAEKHEQSTKADAIQNVNSVRGLTRATCAGVEADKKLRFKSMLEGFGLDAQEITDLPPELEVQADKYMEQVQTVESMRGKDVESPEMRKRLAMQYYLIREFLQSRNDRIEDIKSPAVRHTQEMIEARFNEGTNHGLPKSTLCVDGRLLSKLMGGFLGGAYHSPAGGNPEFREGADADGKMYLEEGTFSSMIDEHLSEYDGITEILDSHLACAAGCKNTAAAHNFPTGKEPKTLNALALYEDVMLKKQKAGAIKDYVERKYEGTKETDVMQVSFDPHNGALFMGLEKEENLALAKQAGGFTPELLAELTEKGEAIDTHQLAEGPLKTIFTSHWFALDYVENYQESTHEFNAHIGVMNKEALEKIKPVLIKAFPALGLPASAVELKKRAELLLSNAYSHFLLTRDKDGKPSHYPFSEHRETFITVTRSEKGPYGEESFFIAPSSPEKHDDIELTRGLIKGNREAGRMYSEEKMVVGKVYGEGAKEAYATEPVPIVFFSRFEADIYEHPEILKRIQDADWSSLSNAKWIDMSEDEFRDFVDRTLDVEGKSLPLFVYEALGKMRKEATTMYKSSHVTSKNLRNGNLTPIWSLADQDRKTVALIPFVTKGFPKKD